MSGQSRIRSWATTSTGRQPVCSLFVCAFPWSPKRATILTIATLDKRYLMIECADLTQKRMYGLVSYQYQSAMTASGVQRRESLRRQGELIETLASLAKNIKLMRETRPKKVCQGSKSQVLSSYRHLFLPTRALIQLDRKTTRIHL